MKTILLFNRDKKIFFDIRNLRLKHCKLIFLSNVKFLKHYVEEFFPSFVIIPTDLENLQDFLKFISNRSDIRLIITACDRSFSKGNYGDIFFKYKNLFLKNVLEPKDYRKILSVIDNNVGAGEKNLMMDLNSSTLTDSVKQSFKIINQQVISVFSLQGGVGKTTLAFNLAFYLKNIGKLKILLIDLNFSEGQSDLSLALGLPETPNLSCYIERIADDYDAFLDSILSLKKFNIDFIQPPLSIFQSDKFGVDMLDNLIYHARNEYNFIIADIPYRYDNISLEMLNLSTVLIFLMFPSPGAVGRIKNFKRLLQGNQKKGIIINNVFGFSDFCSEVIIDDLGIPVLGSIPFLGNEKKDFLRAGKFKTGILNLQKGMAGLAGRILQ